MEEPPKIERIISSRAVSLADASSILNSYVSDLDRYHQHASQQWDGTYDDDDHHDGGKGDDDGGENDDANATPARRSRREREEEALLAQMDQLASATESMSAGMISDDVYERLRTISRSMIAAVEGRRVSACGTATAGGGGAAAGGSGDGESAAEPHDAQEKGERNEADGVTATSDGQNDKQSRGKSKRDKKAAKKAAKKAKKAAKKAKRKGREPDGENASKRLKAE